MLGGGTVNRGLSGLDSLRAFHRAVDGCSPWRSAWGGRALASLSLHQVAAAGGVAPVGLVALPDEEGLC